MKTKIKQRNQKSKKKKRKKKEKKEKKKKKKRRIKKKRIKTYSYDCPVAQLKVFNFKEDGSTWHI